MKSKQFLLIRPSMWNLDAQYLPRGCRNSQTTDTALCDLRWYKTFPFPFSVLQWGPKSYFSGPSLTFHWGVATSGLGNLVDSSVMAASVELSLLLHTVLLPPRELTWGLSASLPCQWVKHYEAFWFLVTTHLTTRAQRCDSPSRDYVTSGCLPFSAQNLQLQKDWDLEGSESCNRLQFVWPAPLSNRLDL